MRESLLAQSPEKVGHLDGGQRGVGAFIAALCARAVDRLLDSVGGQHTEDNRNAGLQRDLADAAGRLAGNIIEVRRVAANDGAQGDNRVMAILFGHRLYHNGSSQEPGTFTISMLAGMQPERVSVSTAPASSRSVMKLLNLATTMANFSPVAFRLPSMVLRHSAWRYGII